MKACPVLLSAFAVATLSAGCSATTRHKVLTFLFDGVPPVQEAGAAGAPRAAASAGARAAPGPLREHGPYAARLCNACHEAAATNALVVPKEQLCSRCHDLRLDRPYVHGPLASGGCLVCHDPHGTANRSLLVSDSDSFCFHCHDRRAIARISGHGGALDRCTACHEAHLSDKKFLLR